VAREQRQSVRIPVNGELSARLVGGPPIAVAVLDFSAGGVLLETTEPLTVGMIYEIEIVAKPANQPVTCWARCAHCRRCGTSGHFAAGFAFRIADPDQIDALLDQLTGTISFQ
jgi:hypothetical protein